MAYISGVFVLSLVVCSVLLAQAQRYNPTILQDSRDLPQVDGAFGFLYRTEDGISHGAVGKPGGNVQGRFTYTDPTGLKVNFNYNAAPNARRPQAAPAPQYQQQPVEGGRPAPQPQFEEYDDGSYKPELYDPRPVARAPSRNTVY